MKERNVNNQHLPETCSLWVVAGLTLNSLQVEISRSVAYWQKYRSILFYAILKSHFSTNSLYFPCVACAACSGMTVRDKSWAAAEPGLSVLLRLQELGHARRYFLLPEGFPVSILLIPSLAVRRIKNTKSVLIFKT